MACEYPVGDDDLSRKVSAEDFELLSVLGTGGKWVVIIREWTANKIVVVVFIFY